MPVVVPPPRIALVLGGGGARGFAHVGVLRVLDQERLPIGLVVGTSVGSLIGALYAADASIFDLEWKAFSIQREDLFDFSLLSAATGPVKGQAIMAFVAKHIKAARIEELRLPFIAVATDLSTGALVALKSGGVADAVRASTAIPGVFTPAVQGGRMLVDGGVVANVPVSVARQAGADLVVAVNITEKVTNTNIRDVIDITLQAINIMMGRMAQAELDAADVVISPPIGDVGTLDFTQKKRCMEAGIATAQAALPALRAAVEQYYRARGGVPPTPLW